MINSRIAEIFRSIAMYLDAKGVEFKPRAYQKAAQSLETLEKDLKEIYKEGGLKALAEIPGVGKSLASKIKEYLETGQIAEYENLKKELPVDMEELAKIEGLGPKTIFILYEKLKIKNISDLERALEKHQIRNLEGFGEKSEENLELALEFFKKSAGRFLLGEIYDEALKLKNDLAKVKGVSKIEIAGSIRRFKETIGDIDILAVSSNPIELMNRFISLENVAEVYMKGKTKSALRLIKGIDVDLRIVPLKSWGSALNYFTGSKEHNIALREIAKSKGLKLNEYGLFKIKNNQEIQIAGETEKELYFALKMNYIEPEMRENTGEIELALAHRLPKLVKLEDIKGDLQVHSNWSDGKFSMEEMVEQALKLNYQYLLFTDHSKSLGIANGMNEEKVLKQMSFIDKLNQKYRGKIKILKGIELNILKDGRVDISDKILEKLDIVGASIHSYFRMTKNEMTNRIKKAMANKNIDIIFHPTGRLLLQREAYEVDMEELFKYAQKTKTIFEINASYERLDLSDNLIRLGSIYNVLFSLGTDSHYLKQLNNMIFGVGQARRGWLSKEKVINSKNSKELIDFIENK
ncbi:MAG TPA: DNA polymerase/3'-5' exonuclease PolX [Candidatus Paceibacterota bacterium]|nr:DNA polymerase/3'-5' exonuclease PolX [Candidatus Paceibacterota bacterium]